MIVFQNKANERREKLNGAKCLIKFSFQILASAHDPPPKKKSQNRYPSNALTALKYRNYIWLSEPSVIKDNRIKNI